MLIVIIDLLFDFL